jgi:hypothetical protein
MIGCDNSDSRKTHSLEISNSILSLQTVTLGPMNAAQSIGLSKPVRLFFFCGCETCKGTARLIVSRKAKTIIETSIAVFSIPPADAKQFLNETGLRMAAVYDPDERLQQRLGTSGCPRAAIVTNDKAIFVSKESPPHISKETWKVLQDLAAPPRTP